MGTKKQIKERTQKQTNQKPTSLVPVHRSGREAFWCLIVILRTSTAEKNHSNILGPNSVTLYLSLDM